MAYPFILVFQQAIMAFVDALSLLISVCFIFPVIDHYLTYHFEKIFSEIEGKKSAQKHELNRVIRFLWERFSYEWSTVFMVLLSWLVYGLIIVYLIYTRSYESTLIVLGFVVGYYIVVFQVHYSTYKRLSSFKRDHTKEYRKALLEIEKCFKK